MNTAAIKFDAFENLKNQDCQQRILKARKVLGDKIVGVSVYESNFISFNTKSAAVLDA